jgi:ribosomal protein S18 acetylase RimI-like enzyme
MTKDIEVIRLTPDEWQEYRQLRIEMLTEEPQAFNSKVEEVSGYPEEYWRERLADPNKDFRFAKRDGRLIGVMNLSYNEKEELPGVAVIHGAYVRKDTRGLGVGKTLLSTLIEAAAMSGQVKVLKLWVKDSQSVAIDLYTKAGFSFSEKAGEHTLVMQRTLD